MTNYLEILRLKSIGCSNRKIASSVKSSHNTVKTVLELAQKNGISYPLDSNVSNSDLEKLFFPYRKMPVWCEKNPIMPTFTRS